MAKVAKTIPRTIPSEVAKALLALDKRDLPGTTWREKGAAEEKLYKILHDYSETRTEGDLVGFIVSFQVADGYANYMVMSTNPLSLVYIRFMDEYTIPDAHLRGLRMEDIRAQWRLAQLWKGMRK